MLTCFLKTHTVSSLHYQKVSHLLFKYFPPYILDLEKGTTYATGSVAKLSEFPALTCNLVHSFFLRG